MTTGIIRLMIAIIIMCVISFLLLPLLFDAIKEKKYYKMNSGRTSGNGVSNGMIYDAESGKIIPTHKPLT